MNDINTKAAAVGHIPSGLFIVCARDKKSRIIDGYLASWVQQVSFDPLMISLAVKPGRPAYGHIINGEIFTVNIIGDHDNTYIDHFWSGYDPKKNPFDALAIKEGKAGGCILEVAKSAIECRRHSGMKPGDHDIIVAEVLNSYVLNNEARPLVHVRKSGMTY